MQNILVFTVNKAASMLLYELGKTLARHVRLPFWSVNDGTFPEKGLAEDPDAFDGKHGCFCPLRYYTEAPDMDQAALVLHLRDPRDAITSQFYSLAYSHPPVAGTFNPTEAKRQEWIDAGVDAHARAHAARWIERYQTYIDRVLGRPNTTFVTYEQMVADFPAWLAKFMAPFALGDAERLHKKLARKYRNNFAVKREDVRKQKRQIAPGDHKRKLQPDTIAYLNKEFASILETLGYKR
ncbi:MAG: sulfotransferase domain-containing protein [Verrucomicrobia bacterium]|nr:sulfotransferase domain-containing protein [Verrucomicrobiota bacterium]